jgi:dolichyl-phosphate-mannose--protein O-mannosyl transferase
MGGKFNKYLVLLYISIILVVSSFVILYNYDYPANLYWDENYHISSAQKYLSQVFFYDLEPPLGKLFIAVGEKIINPNQNINTSSFLSVDYIKEIPEGYSFKGVRLFPVLFAFLCPLVFFMILYTITRKLTLSALFSFIYLFDNALVVHFRGAMLESTQMFFVLVSIALFVNYFNRHEESSVLDYFTLAVFVALASCVKINALILLLLPLALFIKANYEKIILLFSRKFFFAFLNVLKHSIKPIMAFSLGFIITSILIFSVHFSSSQKIVEGKDYSISYDYKIMVEKGNVPPVYFFTMLNDYYMYSTNYAKAIPSLNFCKEGETASYPLQWLVGARAINYRWEGNDNSVKYLYLVPNPVVWLIGLVGLIVSLAMIIAVLVFKMKVKNKNLFSLVLVFTIMHVCYMITMLQIARVLYLYHYFIPLVFSLILFYLQFNYIFEEQISKNSPRVYVYILIIVIATLFLFWFLSPLTYYEPLTTKEFMKRAIFGFWDMKPIILMAP